MLVLRLADPRDGFRIVEALNIAADTVEAERAPLAARYRTIADAIGDGVDASPLTPAAVVPVGDCVCGGPVVIDAPVHVGAWLLVVEDDGAVRLERVGTDIGTPG